MLYNIGSVFGRRKQQIQGQELIGVVVNDKHPEGKHGLIQVRIRNLHDGWADKDLPWQKARQGYGAGDSAITEVEPIPPIGTKVYCRAEDNTQYHMTYRAGPPSEDKHNSELINDDYPNVYGRVDRGGNLERTNNKEGKNEYEYEHQSGTKLKIDNDGNIVWSGAKKLILSGKEGVEILGKNVIIQAEEDVDSRAGRDNFRQAKRYVRKRADEAYKTYPAADETDDPPESPDNPKSTQARQRPNPSMEV